jgi:large subunit ribosomal protein L13
MAKASEVERKWFVVDAAGQTLGRLASEVASIIRGKHKPQFTPHVDTGDFVVVINADKVVLTGKKLQNKKYYRHSLYAGGLKVTVAQDMLKNNAERMIELAVHGMLPKTRLGQTLKTKLKVYAGSEHPHSAQQPEVWTLRG